MPAEHNPRSLIGGFRTPLDEPVEHSGRVVDGQGKSEGAAISEFAFDVDLAEIESDQLFGDIQPETKSLGTRAEIRSRFGGTVEK